MIDINRLYEIAPELAPKSFQRKPSHVHRSLDFSEGSFRDVLLKNIQNFRTFRKSGKIRGEPNSLENNLRISLNGSVKSRFKSSYFKHSAPEVQGMASSNNYSNSSKKQMRTYSIFQDNGSLHKVSSFFHSKRKKL
jgi:hypothetical protein